MNLSFDSIDDLNEFLNWASIYSGAARRPLAGVSGSGSVGDVAFGTPQRPLQAAHVSLGAGLDNETRVYTDGTTVTGPGPLPDLSPAQQGESKGAEPAKRGRRTKAEIAADAKRIADSLAANEAADANRAENFEEAGKAMQKAAEGTQTPTGANPFEVSAPDHPHPGNETDKPAEEPNAEPDESVVTPFQHLTRAREFIAKHGMPKYNESFTKAGLDANVMAYSAFQRALHLTALDELEKA